VLISDHEMQHDIVFNQIPCRKYHETTDVSSLVLTLPQLRISCYSIMETNSSTPVVIHTIYPTLKNMPSKLKV